MDQSSQTKVDRLKQLAPNLLDKVSSQAPTMIRPLLSNYLNLFLQQVTDDMLDDMLVMLHQVIAYIETGEALDDAS